MAWSNFAKLPPEPHRYEQIGGKTSKNHCSISFKIDLISDFGLIFGRVTWFSALHFKSYL
jgi:hypothetical protein